MIRATDLYGVLRVTKPTPLRGEDFKSFFCDTDQARGIKAAENLRTYLTAHGEDPQKILFMGHTHSGKSTELERFSQLMGEDYRIINFSLREEVNLLDLEPVDLVFVVLRKLFLAAEEDQLSLDDNLLKSLDKAWHEEQFIEQIHLDKTQHAAGFQVAGGFFKFVTAFIKGELHRSTENKKMIREQLKPRISELVQQCNDLVYELRQKYLPLGKIPILIIEDLDKVDIAIGKELFLEQVNLIRSFNLHTIYTFPIFLHYTRHFEQIIGYFDHYELLSMIKVRTREGAPFELGRTTLRGLVEKRVDLSLFEAEIVDWIIDKSGGSIRHIFEMLQNAALHALTQTQEKNKIGMESALSGYHKLRNYYERIISHSDVQILKMIQVGKDNLNLNDDDSLELLRSLALIEYNGKRWCGVHPVVKDFLDEKDSKNL